MFLELLDMIYINLEYELAAQRDNTIRPGETLDKTGESLPLNVGLEAVEEAVKRLHSLGSVIRNTALIKDQQQWPFNESHFYKIFVNHRFPKAQQSLVDHIGRSLHVRGKSMFYRQQYNRQLLAKGLLHPVSAQTSDDIAQSTDSNDSDMPDSIQKDESNATSYTTSWKENREEDEAITRMHGSSDSSNNTGCSSSGDSFSEASGSDERFIYPQQPDVEKGQQNASCPVCLEPVDLFNLPKQAFRDHMDRDVEPYVCISEECQEPLRFFAHLDDWENHMQTMHTPNWAQKIHTITWCCDVETCKGNADGKEFADKGGFIQHLSTAHPKKLTKPQILAKARRNRTTKARDPLTCPLCECRPEGMEPSSEDASKQLAEHIARELKRLVFASSSYLEDEYSASISLNTCMSGESGKTNHRLYEEPFEDTELGIRDEAKVSLEDSSGPPELEEPVIWPTSLTRVYYARDLTLELFTAALQRPYRERINRRCNKMMEQVNSQEPYMKALAIRSLLWVTFAKRPMTGPEVRHAIIVKAGDRNLDERRLRSIDDIIEACAGFLVANADGDTLRLADEWMSGWLKETWPDWLRDTHEGITATICLTYLLFDVFGSGFCPSDEEFEERLRAYPFYSYAAHNWVHHTRNDIRGNPLIWDFLQSEEKVSASYQALVAEEASEGYSQIPPSRVTGLHLAVHFGLELTVRDLLQDTFDPDVTDSHGRTPLSWAAERNEPGIVVTLLEQGADVNNCENRGGFAPLSWAAWKGLMNVVELLLQFGADTDARDSNLYTPLLLATWNGHGAIIELLVDKGAYVDAADVSGRTPLLLAAKNGYHSIVEHLLEHGANIESRDDDGNSSLSWAVKMGHRAVIELLVELGADVEAEDARGQTPLAWALENGKEDIVTLLLETEVKDEPRHKDKGDSRSRAASSRKHGKDRRPQPSTDEDSATSSDEEESEEDGEGTKVKKPRDKGKAPSTGNPLKKPRAPRSLDYGKWRRLKPSE